MLRWRERGWLGGTLAVAMAAMAVGGCGGSDSADADDETAKRQAKAAYERSMDLWKKRDAEAVCAAMTKDARRRLAAAAPKQGVSCERQLARIMAAFGGNVPPELPRVVAVRMNGDDALLRTRTPDGNVSTVRVVQEGGDWKIDGERNP